MVHIQDGISFAVMLSEGVLSEIASKEVMHNVVDVVLWDFVGSFPQCVALAFCRDPRRWAW